jgi:intraflagellar transport protein 52
MMADQQQPPARELQPKVCFNACRKELLQPNKGFKQLHRKLKQFCAVEVNKEDIQLEKLLPFDLVVFGTPQEDLADGDLKVVKDYLDLGGSVLMTLGDGHGGKYSYLNQRLEQWFGIGVNEDCVVRTVLHKYFHPKEVCVTNGVTNREINRAAGKVVVGAAAPSQGVNAFGVKGKAAGAARPSVVSTGTNFSASRAGASGSFAAGGGASAEPVHTGPTSLVFVYPHGLTMNVQRPAVPILSSGFMAYPLNRPIGAVWESSDQVDHNGQKKKGKLMVLGSGMMLDDQWLPKEENDKLATVLFDYLFHHLKLNQIDADEPDVTDYHYLPDTASLAERLRVAVEESEELPRDFTKLFDFTTFKLDTNLIPSVISTYQKLNIKHEPLTLIPPEFQAPLPPRLPATFEPTHREPPPPALDLFDLDEHFAPERVRLSQLTNKCSSDDLEFYITEGSEIIGVTKKLRSPRNRDPRALLDYIFRQIVQYKKLNLEGGAPGGSAGASSGPQVPRSASEVGGGMTRIIRVSAQDDGACDTVPFDQNAPWSMALQCDFGAGTIAGSIVLNQGSMAFPAQQVQVAGNINNQRELPLEFGCVVQATNGEQVPFVFLAAIQGSTLRGVCEIPVTGSSQNFLYMMDDSQQM